MKKLMKTFKRLGSAGLAVVVSLACASAQEAIPYQASGTVNLLQQPPKSPTRASKAQRAMTLSPVPDAFATAKAIAPGSLVLNEGAANASGKASRKMAKAPASSFTGQWIMTYKGAASGSPSGGNAINIRKVEGNDSVYLEGFWQSATTLYGFYHEDTGNITIPWQKIATSTYYGALNIGVVSASTGYRVTTQDVTISCNDDGTLSIDGIWGIFITSGDYSGNIMDAFYNTTYQKGNATMSHVTSDVTDTYPVIAKQSSPNTVTITNFRNLGHDVDIYLNRDKSAVIKSQVGYQTTATASYYTVGDVVLDDSGTPTSWSDNINIAASTNTRQFKMSNWSMIYGSKYWIGLVTESTIDLPFDVSYPDPLTSTEFDGEGTAASPWFIKSYDDLELLGNMVSASDDASGLASDGTTYARPFQGKYFKMTADIDLDNRRIEPIGDATHHFAGTFDGDGHTIKNLYLSRSDRYAAFFAQLDTLSTVKNVNFDKAYVYTSSMMPAVLATEDYGVIDNVHVNNAYIQCPSQGAAGIAAIAKTVNNCSVENSTIISGNGFCGSLTAQLTGSLKNSHASNVDIIVAVSGTTIPPVGGLVGAANTSPIDNCYFNGEIYGLNSSYPCRMGGITGTSSNTTISNCFTNATLLPLNHSSAYTGGIVAQFFGTMTNCYSTGTISASASKLTGGLAGLTQYRVNSDETTTVSTFTNCYTATVIKALTTDYNATVECRELAGNFGTAAPPTFNNCYFDKQVTDFGSNHGAYTSQLVAAAGPEGFDASAWTFTAGSYPRLTTSADSGIAKMSATAIVLSEDATYAMCTSDATFTTLGNTKVSFIVNGAYTDQGKYATIDNGTIKLNTNYAFGTDSIAIYGEGMMTTRTLNVVPLDFAGQGTAENPFLIKDKNDLIKLSKMTSTSGVSYSGMHFKMTNDIDLEYDTEFKGLSVNTNTSVTFHSIFDGDGHTIHNMRINNIVWKVKPEDDPDGLGTVDTSTNAAAYNGFIGRLASDGELRNLTIAADCDIQVFASSAAFVGICNGLIENCRNYADVIGQSSWIGGIAGQTNQGAIVRNCYNSGKIKTGYRNAGGIVGSHHGTMENCVNVGHVEATPGYQKLGKGNLKYAGGITGGEINGIINNCLNAGSVYAAEGNAGGISGSTPKNLSSTTAGNGTNDITNCISYGIVMCGDILTSGGIAGESGTVGTVSNNVWDAQILPIGAFANDEHDGCTGVNTSVLTNAAGITGFDSQYWQFSDGAYPVLKTFADDELLNKAAAIVVKFADTDNAQDLNKNATLADGMTWSLKKGTTYAINGSTLVVPSEFTTVVLDTLVAVNGSITKEIPLRSIPVLDLSGKGTQADPYLLNNAADWNLLADFMNKTGNDFTDTFFKMTADIDFTGATFSPLGVSPTYFNATLDGDNHAITGYDYTSAQQYAAPIGYLDTKGVVKNLTVKGTVTSSYSTNAKTYAGGIVGQFYGKMDNCQLDGSVIASAKGYVGGLVGKAFTGSSFTNCRNRGLVKGATYLGGIAAECETQVTFDNCNNEGTIENAGTSSTTSNYIGGIVALAYESTFTNCYNKCTFVNIANSGYVGGLIGQATGAKNEIFYTISNCYNASDISGRVYIGGLTATSSSTVGAAIMMIDNCYNTGNLTTSAASNYMGGIVCYYTPGSVISNCWNSGTITNTKGTFCGGIAGAAIKAPTTDYPVVIVGCENRGAINAMAGCGGGIVGNLNAYSTIQECVNYGTITGTYGLGGIVSAAYGANCQVADCINLGDVISSMNRCGGIVGYNGASGGTGSAISGCVNLGNVSTSCTTTGTSTTTTAPSGFAIGGIAGMVPSSIENCANFGNVTGASSVGGILGQSVKAKTTLSNCYTVGKVNCASDQGGNVIGSDLTLATLWTTGNSATNCYYLSENGSLSHDTSIATPATRAELTKLNLDENWVNGDDYTYPIPAAFAEHDATLVNAAQIVPADGETTANISHNFKVGNPSGITWTASPADMIEFSGNDATVKDTYTGEVTLTVTKGEYSRKETVNIDYKTGMDSLYSGKTVVNEQYYDLNGTSVSKPAAKDGRFYIVRLTYSDGTASTVKLLNN